MTQKKTIDVPETLVAPLQAFIDAWLSVPPLVRASFAVWLIDWGRDRLRSLHAHSKGLLEIDERRLARRILVNGKFRQAAVALVELGVALAKHADDEAEMVDALHYAAGDSE